MRGGAVAATLFPPSVFPLFETPFPDLPFQKGTRQKGRTAGGHSAAELRRGARSRVPLSRALIVRRAPRPSGVAATTSAACPLLRSRPPGRGALVAPTRLAASHCSTARGSGGCCQTGNLFHNRLTVLRPHFAKPQCRRRDMLPPGALLEPRPSAGRDKPSLAVAANTRLRGRTLRVRNPLHPINSHAPASQRPSLVEFRNGTTLIRPPSCSALFGRLSAV